MNKAKTLKRFNELEELVKSEIEMIATELMNECDSYEEVINDITDYYESEFGLDDFVYQAMHRKAMKQATKK